MANCASVCYSCCTGAGSDDAVGGDFATDQLAAPVTSSPAISKGLFLCRTHHCIDQSCSAEPTEATITEQPKCDAATVADRPSYPDAKTFPEVGAGTKAD
jgi:hypothetical protein